MFRHRRALHVTLRMAAGVWNLRAKRPQVVIERVLRSGANRFGTRVVEISVMGNHVHLLVEAPDHVALSRAMKGFGVRLGIHLNRLMGRKGERVVGERYNSRLLSTPTEVRRASHYIRNNHRKHEAQRGIELPSRFVDPCSSRGHLRTAVAAPTLYLIRMSIPALVSPS